MDIEERRALTIFCQELGALRDECAHHSEHRRHLLERIEAEAKARRPILKLLGELLDAGPDDTRRMLSISLPGLGPGQADEELFGCPDSACDRVCEAAPAGPPPRCALMGMPMHRR